MEEDLEKALLGVTGADDDSNSSQDEDSSSEDEYDNAFDDNDKFYLNLDYDLIGDEADRLYVESLNEIEREELIYERRKKKEALKARQLALRDKQALNKQKKKKKEKKKKKKKKEKKEKKKKKNKSKTKNKPSSHSSLPPVERKKRVIVAQNNKSKAAISDLQKKLKQSKRKYDSDEDADYIDPSAISSPESDGRYDDDRHYDTRSPSPRKSDYSFDIDDLHSLQVKRDQLEQWLDTPSFDDDRGKGLFVRVYIGPDRENKPVYRIATVKGVQSDMDAKKYKINQRETTTVLILQHADKDKTFRGEFVSNQKATTEEFEKWKKNMLEKKKKLPTARQYKQLKQNYDFLCNLKYTDKIVAEIVQHRKQKGTVKIITAEEKAKLETMRLHYQEAGDHEQLAKINEQLAELNKEQTNKVSSGISISAINKRNNRANFAYLTGNTENDEAGETDSQLNPFSRRPTFVFQSLDDDETENVEDEAQKQLKEKEQRKRLFLEEKKKREQQREETLAPQKITKRVEEAHNFDIDIEVNLANSTDDSTGTLKQTTTTKTTTTTTTTIKKKKGRKRKRAGVLSLTDYKRRRGLIDG